MEPVDPYRVLQVALHAEQEVIQAAYRALALKYHPDRDRTTYALRRMLQVNAVYLDVGDTVMRPSPSWEQIYAMAFAEYGIQVDVEALRIALRQAYHHGGWGMAGGFEPNEESSFQRTVEIDRLAIAGLGIGPLPDAFFRRLSALFLVTSHWHVFPEVPSALSDLRAR